MGADLLGLAGKVVVITGSSQGVGLGCARQFARAGCDVLLVGRRAEPLARAEEEVRGIGQRVATVVADVESDAEIAAIVDAAERHFGRIDVAVNNVGGRRGKPEGLLLESGPDYWRGTLERNLITTLACTQAFARAMIAGGRPGVIVNISSVAAHNASLRLAPYSAAKAGLDALTRSLAHELAPHRIRVVGVAPGMVDTDSLRAWMTPEQLAERGRALPAGRIGGPDDIGRAAVMLASDLAGWIYGDTLIADGGELLGH
jgi:NAD(P)-dependent dehydrogenase (short-subunit alcohol dehydrogenase family)